MKWTIILSMFLCSLVQGANEINAFAPGVTAAYSVVRQADGDVWYVTGQVFEAWGTGARTAADYDIAITSKSGNMFVGNFDTNIAAGYYHIATHYQAGGAPADSDPVVWTEYGYWDGTLWNKTALYSDVNDIVSDMNDVNDTGIAAAVWNSLIASFTGAGTFGLLVQDINDTVDLIVADTNELQTDWHNGGRLDTLIDLIKYKTDLITILDTTVAEANDANSFTLTDGIDVNDALNYHLISVTDASDSHTELRYIYRWRSSKVLYVDMSFGFTPAAGDVVHIMGTGYGGFFDMLYSCIRRLGITTYYTDLTKKGGVTPGAGVTNYNQLGDDPP